MNVSIMIKQSDIDRNCDVYSRDTAEILVLLFDDSLRRLRSFSRFASFEYLSTEDEVIPTWMSTTSWLENGWYYDIYASLHYYFIYYSLLYPNDGVSFSDKICYWIGTLIGGQ